MEARAAQELSMKINWVGHLSIKFKRLCKSSNAYVLPPLLKTCLHKSGQDSYEKVCQQLSAVNK